MPRSKVKWTLSSSSSRPMIRQYRKELDAAASLLALPGDVTDLLLEYVASEPEAILNLRQVCTTTKGWIDFMRPSQAKRFFSRIPIHVDLDNNNVGKFHKCAPPPSVSALILKLHDRAHKDPKHWERLKNMKTAFPGFFDFWETQMSSLSVGHYATTLLETFGPPKALRNLTSWDIMVESHSSLLQLETVAYHHISEPSVINFFRQMANNPNLQRLSVEFYDGNKIGRPKPVELVQIVLDAKRNDVNFQLNLYWDFENTEDELTHFLASFAASASTIRLYSVSNELADQVLRLCPKGDPDEGVIRRFFESIQSMNHKGTLENSCLFLKQSLFRNLKKLYVDIPEGNEARLEMMEFPSGIEHLTIASGRSGKVVPRNLPLSLRFLELRSNHYRMSDHSRNASPDFELLAESLSRISQSCPFLEELEIESDIHSSGYSPNSLREYSYSFKNLKSLDFFGDIIGEAKQKKADGRRLMECLLFDIFRVQEMSLQKLIVKCSDMYWVLAGIGVQLDSGAVERLLNCPSANSLIYLGRFRVIEEAKESFDKLKAMVEKNEGKYRERYGNIRKKASYDFFECSIY